MAAQSPRLAAMAASLRRSGHRILSHRLDFYGLCPACRNHRDAG